MIRVKEGEGVVWPSSEYTLIVFVRISRDSRPEMSGGAYIHVHSFNASLQQAVLGRISSLHVECEFCSRIWLSKDGNGSVGHGSNGSPNMNGSHGSCVTASDPLTHCAAACNFKYTLRNCSLTQLGILS